MRTLKKIILGALAALPVASINVAAHSKLLDIAGEEQNDLLQSNVFQAKQMLFPSGRIQTTIEAAKEQVQMKTGIKDSEALDAEVQKNIEILMNQGLIEINENKMLSHIPSA